MKLFTFFALFCVLSAALGDTWVDLSPSDLDDFEVNQALNFGASNLTQDAINKGHIPEGVYHISAIESAQKKVDLTDNDDGTDDNDQSWDNDYRFVVEIINGEGSGLDANYTVHVDVDRINGQQVYAFYLERYVYNWFTNLDETEFGNEEFEWIHENEWNEFNQPAENEALIVSSGSESVIDASDEPDSEVLVIQGNGEAQWVNIDTIIPPDQTDNDS